MRSARLVSVIGFALLGMLALGQAGMTASEEITTDGDTAMVTEEKATFAGGCFWCMQSPYDKVPGVVSTTVGYTGGTEEDPTYQEVSAGRTGHAEAIEIVYDSAQVSYAQLLDVFWRNIDPTAIDRQFSDVGKQYRTAIFYHNDDQQRLALESKQQLEASGRYDQAIVTEITPASAYYQAEEYHHQYYKKNPIRYNLYRIGSGRDRYLKKVWGDEAGGVPHE